METDDSSATAVAEPESPATVTPGTSQPAASPEANTDQGTTEGLTADEGEKGEAAPPSPYPITVPEGMEVNTALMEAVTPIFQEMGLKPEQVQTLADAYSRIEGEREKASTQAHLDQMATWQEEVKADTELGGQKYTENLAIANQGLKHAGTPELIALLQETGYGNHKEFIRAFHKVGMGLQEGAMVHGNPTGDGKTPLANRLFPSMKE